MKNLSILLLLFVSSVVAKENNNLGQKIDAFLAENQLPGLVLIVKKNDEFVYYNAHGSINVKNQDKSMKKDSIFRIFSMAKPVTAIAVLQLVDKGLITLDSDIRKYLPSFDEFEYDGQTHVVTVHQLLNHTAGFGYGGGIKSWTDIRYLIANPLSRSNNQQDLIDDISGIPLKYVPGEKWEYSIASDIQAGLVEAVTKMPFDEYIQKNILDPLNMKDTHFYVPEKDKSRLVDMYEHAVKTFEEAHAFKADKIEFIETGKESEYLENPTLKSGGGGLVSTALDYSQFVTMLLNKGEYQGKRIVSEKMLEKMLVSYTDGMDMGFMPRVYDNTGFGYSIGVKTVTDKDSKDPRNKGSFYWAGMGGTMFWADPALDLQVVAMMQVEDGWIALEKWLVPLVYQMNKEPHDHNSNR